MSRQERRQSCEPDFACDLDDEPDLERSRAEAVEREHRGWPALAAERRRRADADEPSSHGAPDSGGAFHPSPRLMPYARIFLCKFVRSTPSAMLALLMFQSKA